MGWGVGWLGLATAVFRCDVVVLAVPLLLVLLGRREIGLGKLILIGTLVGLLSPTHLPNRSE